MKSLCEPLSAHSSALPSAPIAAPRRAGLSFLRSWLSTPCAMQAVDDVDAGILTDLGIGSAAGFAGTRMLSAGHERLQAIRASEFAPPRPRRTYR